jgi:cardiolipin-specific phospholipase
MSKTRQVASAATDVKSKTIKAVEETENWFVESLEPWRRDKNIKSFTLMSHSMGSYLAAAYAFKYPENVNKLIMVSPAGVETGYTLDLDESSFLSLFRKDLQIEQIKEMGPELQEFGPNLNVHDGTKYQEPERLSVGKLFTHLWDKHMSPFIVVRSSSFFGPKLVSN